MRFIVLLLFLCILATGIASCKSDEVYVKFTIMTKDFPSDEIWKVFADGVLIYANPALDENTLCVVEACLPTTTNNQYTIKMIDPLYSVWFSYAYLQAEGINGNRIFKYAMLYEYDEEFPLSLYAPINKNDSWKLTTDVVTSTWTEYNFSDSNWNQVTLGSVTATVSGTQYFRKQFVGLAGMAAYEASFNYRYGIVAYINGVEIFRDNMPEGAPTSSTAATNSYPSVEYHAIIRPGAEVANTQSILAVEIHFLTTSGQDYVDFNSYLAIYAKNVFSDDNCYAYPYDISFTGTSSHSDANSIMDYYQKSSYSHFQDDIFPAIITFNMTGPKAYFNGYRVWSSEDAFDAPSDYILQGTNDLTAGIWTNIVVASNLVYRKKDYLNAFGYFNASLYTHYRLQISQPSSSTDMYLYEAYPLTCITAIPTFIEFQQSTYSFYAKYQEVEVRPIVKEFTACTINPAPVAGLVFNTTTCTLSGIATADSTTQYTISSFLYGQIYTGTFTLQIIDCTGTILKPTRTYQDSAVYEGFTIKDAATQNIILEVTPISSQFDEEEWSTLICVTGTQYIVTVFSSAFEYWQAASFLYINAMLDSEGDYETILRVNYDIKLCLPTSYTFNPQYAIKSFESWNYKMGEVPANWYSSDISGWPTGTAGNFPASSNQIQLYKKTFSVTNVNNMAGVVISFKHQYGYIIYLNNHEVASKGFTGDLSTETFSSTSLNDCNYRQISLPIKTMSDGTTTPVDYITTGTNTIAIGLIAAGSNQTTSSFDAAVRLMGAESVSRIWKVSADSMYITGVYEYNNILYFHHPYSIFSLYCHTNFFTISFDNDRREWISSVTFAMYSLFNNQQPRNVVIKAKNPEDSEWTTLKAIEGMTWSSSIHANKIWLINNKAYNEYRFENFSSGNPDFCSWEVYMIDLRSDVTNVNIPALTYEDATVFKDVEIDTIYPNYGYFTDFSISPPLPTGLVIDPYTGIISGTAAVFVTNHTHTISAKKFNTGEVVTTQMSLTVISEPIEPPFVCPEGAIAVYLIRTTKAYSAEESFKIYEGESTEEDHLSFTQPIIRDNEHYIWNICLAVNTVHTIVMTDTYGNGWTANSVIEILIDEGSQYSFMLTNGNQDIKTFLITRAPPLDCSEGHVSVTLFRTTNKYSGEEHFRIYQGMQENPLFLIYTQPDVDSYYIYFWPVCMAINTYHTILMTDRYGDGWYPGSKVEVLVNGNTLYSFTNRNGYSETVNFLVATEPIAPSSFSYDNSTRTIAVGSSLSMSPVIVASLCTFELVSGTLPSGITLNPISGHLEGSPTSITTEQTLVIKASNSAGSLQTTVKLTVQVTISSFSYPEASYSIYKNAVFSATPSVLGNPVTFSLQSGALPSGLSLDPATGTLSGTPTEASPELSLVVKAENGLGSLTTTVSLQVILVLPTSFSYATGVEGWTGVSTDLHGSGSTPSIECEACTFTVESGNLVGFTLNAETGAISGTCTTEKENESTTVTIKAENTSGSTSASISINCYGKPQALVYPKSFYLIQKGKTFTTTPTTCSTYAWFNVTGTLPEGLVFNSATGQIQGTPSNVAFETVNIIKINPSGQVVFSMQFFVVDNVVTICTLVVILLLIVCIVLCCVKCSKKNMKQMHKVRQKGLPRPLFGNKTFLKIKSRCVQGGRYVNTPKYTKFECKMHLRKKPESIYENSNPEEGVVLNEWF